MSSQRLKKAIVDKDVLSVTLILRGMDINEPQKELKYLTPLSYAARMGSPDVVDAILQMGADIEAKDDNGGTALHNAAISGIALNVKMLLDSGADVNARDDFQATPIHLLSEMQSANLLLSHGADINDRDALDQTPLHYASKDGHRQNIEFLLGMGADVNAVSVMQYTCLHTVIMLSGRTAYTCIPHMLEAGVDIDAVCKKGKTALHYASALGLKKTIHLLIGHGANVGIKDIKGKVPVRYASSKDIKLILK